MTLPHDQRPMSTSPRSSFTISAADRLDLCVNKNQTNQESPFLRILQPTIILLRIFGIFPAHKSTLHWKNLWSYIIVAFMTFGYSYSVAFRAIASAVKLFENWTADTVLQFAVSLWFCIALNCLIFLLQFGWGRKLDTFSKNLTQVSIFMNFIIVCILRVTLYSALRLDALWCQHPVSVPCLSLLRRCYI